MRDFSSGVANHSKNCKFLWIHGRLVDYNEVQWPFGGNAFFKGSHKFWQFDFGRK